MLKDLLINNVYRKLCKQKENYRTRQRHSESKEQCNETVEVEIST